MQCSPLSAVKQRLVLGAPVPFNIRNPDHTLLLARGQLLHDEAQLESLFERGAVVDADDIKGPRAEVFEARPEELPALWTQGIARVGRALHAIQQPGFPALLDDAAKPLLALIERDPDLAIFQVVRPESGENTSYGVAHSVYAATASLLVARRLGWDAASVLRSFKAALTMNVAIVDLQTRLALQERPLTDQQRTTLRDHPMRSAQMLQAAGITDMDWLMAVSQHHAPPAGSTPAKISEHASDIAALLRCVDIYTAKLSPRASRSALPANRAGRDTFMEGDKTPIAAAVIKEFGIFPPGCFVKLQSGETAIAIKRGASANTPIVAAIVGRNGDTLLEPVRRNTEAKDHAITGVVAESSLRVRVSPMKLAALAAR